MIKIKIDMISLKLKNTLNDIFNFILNLLVFVSICSYTLLSYVAFVFIDRWFVFLNFTISVWLFSYFFTHYIFSLIEFVLEKIKTYKTK